MATFLDNQTIHEKERLYNFLKKYDLHQYYKKFLLKGVHRLSHLKAVSADESSLDEIGLTRIERQRLKKKVKENVAWTGRFVKKMKGREKEFDAPIPSTSMNLDAEVRRSATIIPREEVKLVRKIGEGAHGSVHEGTWADIHGAVAVAVKTLYGKQEVQNMFIKEANSMTSLNHKHIIQLYGIVLSQPLMLVEELAPFGSLHSYIHKEGKYLTLQLFHTYAYQIADAMSYLEKRRIVHRDLAIRNVLLAHVDHVKLSDFGMARILDENCDVYNLSNLATRIPVAWTAMEALTRAKFSSSSDVWSFGVSIWEIYSLGEIPWKGLGPMEIKDVLIEGERLGRPERCPTDVYELILACWKEDPQMRPNFVEIYERLQLLVPKQVRGIKVHNVDEDVNSLSFKTGDLIYIIDKPSMEWTCGMKTDGSFGHFRSDCVTDILNPISEIRAKLASGKTTVSNISIGSPTDVDHMVHFNLDGSRHISENLNVFFDPTPPPSPDQGHRAGTSSPSTPFRVSDARSPSPKDSPLSPLLRGVDSDSGSGRNPNTPVSNLVDVEVSSKNERTRVTDIKDLNLGIYMPDEYITISHDASSKPANKKATNHEAAPEMADKYVTMQSYSIKKVMDGRERRFPSPPLSSRDSSHTKRRSATLTTGELSSQYSQELDRSTAVRGTDSALFMNDPSFYVNQPSRNNKDTTGDNGSSVIGHQHYDKPRSFTLNSLHNDIPPSSISSRAASLLDSSIGSPGLPPPLMPVSTPSPTKSRRPLSASCISSSSSQTAHIHHKTSIDSSPKHSDHVPFFIPEDGLPGHMDDDALIPKSTRFIYPNSDQPNVSSSWKSPPIPKPRTGVREVSESVGGGGSTTEVDGGSRGTSEETSSPVPPERTSRPVPPPRYKRNTCLSERDYGYEQINFETLDDGNQYMVLNPNPRGKLAGPNEATIVGSQNRGKLATENQNRRSEFEKDKLQSILSDDEFVGCEVEICRFALEQENFDVEKAKEEIRVQILLGMLLPNIREEDCRRALIHCQHNTNRAAAWLLQLSTDIREKIQ